MALSIRDTNSPSSPKRTASPLESDLGTPHKLLPSSTSPRPRRRSLQATSPKVIKRPWHDEVRAATAAARRCTSPPAAAACAAAPLPPPCAAAPPLRCAASASAAPLSRAHHRAGGRARADDGGAARAAQLVGDRREPARPRGQAVPRAVSASRRAACRAELSVVAWGAGGRTTSRRTCAKGRGRTRRRRSSSERTGSGATAGPRSRSSCRASPLL